MLKQHYSYSSIILEFLVVLDRNLNHNFQRFYFENHVFFSFIFQNYVPFVQVCQKKKTTTTINFTEAGGCNVEKCEKVSLSHCMLVGSYQQQASTLSGLNVRGRGLGTHSGSGVDQRVENDRVSHPSPYEPSHVSPHSQAARPHHRPAPENQTQTSVCAGGPRCPGTLLL